MVQGPVLGRGYFTGSRHDPSPFDAGVWPPDARQTFLERALEYPRPLNGPWTDGVGGGVVRILRIADADSVHTLKWTNSFGARGHEVHLVSLNLVSEHNLLRYHPNVTVDPWCIPVPPEALLDKGGGSPASPFDHPSAAAADHPRSLLGPRRLVGGAGATAPTRDH